MPSYLQLGSDVSGLVYDVPPSVTTAAQMLALGQSNDALIQQYIARAIAAGLKRVTFGQRRIVCNNYPFNPSSADEFMVELNGTQFMMAGTDRTTVGGLALFNQCTGVNGFDGNGSVDYIYPQFASGIIQSIVSGKNQFYITLDTDPTWTDFAHMYGYDASTKRYTGHPVYSNAAIQTGASIAGIPIVKATGSNQVTGHDYFVDCTGSIASGYDSTQIVVGNEYVLLHFNGACSIAAVSCDKLRLPEGLRIYSAPNACVYAPNTSVDSDAILEPKMFTSVIASRGRMRGRMAAGGGYLFTPNEADSNIGGRVIAMGDDAIDYTSVLAGINSQSGQTINVTYKSQPGFGPGQIVVLNDGNRVPQFVGTLSAVAAGTTGGTYNLTFPSTVTLPTTTTSWEVTSISASRNVTIKDNTRLELVAGTAIRGSAAVHRIGNVFIDGTMGPAIKIADAGTTEFAPPSVVSMGDITLRNPCSGLGFERIAAVVVRPLLANGGAVAGVGSVKRFDMDELNVEGICYGPALALGGITTARIGRQKYEGLNQQNYTYDLPAGSSITTENCGDVYIDSLDEYGTTTSLVSCLNTTSMTWGIGVKATVPTSGVGTILAPGKWQSFTPTVTAGSPSSGSTTITVQAFRYKWDGVSCRVQARIDIMNWTGAVNLTMPRTCTKWAVGSAYNVNTHAVGEVYIASAGTNQAQIYGNGGGLSSGISTQADPIFFEIEYEAT